MFASNNGSRSEDIGVYIQSCSNSIIVNNTANSNYYGVYEDGFRIGGCDNCLISDNDASWNAGNGLEIYGSNNCTIKRNHLAHNGKTGIIVGPYASNNRIYENNFVDNDVVQGIEELNCSGNIWDDGNSRGNFWSDYRTRYPGATTNDGVVWDTPYQVNASFDRYPLVEQVKYPRATFITNATTIVVGQRVQFNFTGSRGDLPANFSWDFGDGWIVNDVINPLHQFMGLGNYTVTLTITDADGDMDSYSVTIHVVEPGESGNPSEEDVPGFPMLATLLALLLGTGVPAWRTRARIRTGGKQGNKVG